MFEGHGCSGIGESGRGIRATRGHWSRLPLLNANCVPSFIDP
ncbi:hypothetical protein AZ78_2812 [Lysobacter capsici AZ78]|uniref:Uncharacterized protein n=1 Tax=Lysobacter capsici AZ78 TaxID=1444315 RepID=A0A108U9Z3_9GAMM|nr:hypothetical protein AZ78_2812 [Lysobacter capsici AZ78]